jgi:hypothetical protein
MIAWFEGLPVGIGAIVIVGGFVTVSLLLSRVVARMVESDVLVEHNELTGFVFAVVGVTYAVMLGLIAVGVWERFAAAEERTFDESSQLTIVYRDAAAFANGPAIRRDLRGYVNAIITLGYPALESGVRSHPTAQRAEHVIREVQGAQPHGPRESAIYANMLDAMNAAIVDRDARLAEDSSGLNGVMWVVVFVGGFITIAFTYLFGFRRSGMQTAMIGTLALLIGLMIFLTMSLDYPFRGSIRVGTDAFERALYIFDQVDSST